MRVRSLSIPLVTVLVLWVVLAVTLVRRPPVNILSWDTFGYHLYLPAVIIHGDPGLRDATWLNEAIETYHSTGTLYQARELEDGRRVMKYSMGMAVLWSPFFIVAHVVAAVTGHPQDGFSAPYQWGLITATLVYLLIGLLEVCAVLRRFFSDKVATATIALLVLGTNLLHQTLLSTGMPHVFLFALLALLVLFSLRWHERHVRRDAVAIGVVLGLLVLSRPTLLVAALIPVLVGMQDLRRPLAHLRSLWPWRGQLLIAFGIMLLVVSPQLFYWKWIVGKWFYMSYNNAGEGLQFLHPYFAEVLFSFRKGWYIYTPLMLVATAGLALVHRFVPALRWSLVLFFALNLYIVASWSCWWYADSFGQRALVESYALMALPLAAVLAWLAARRPLVRIAGVMLLTGFVVLNLFQTWQSSVGLIHTSRMTWPAYKAVFARTERPAGLDDLLLVDRPYTDDRSAPDLTRYRERKLLTMGFDAPSTREDGSMDPFAFIGNGSFRLEPGREFSPAIRIPWERFTNKDHVWAEVSCRVYRAPGSPPPQVSLVTTFEHDGQSYAYKATDVPQEVEDDGWINLTAWYQSPEPRRPDDEFLVYCWLRGGEPALVDEIGVILHEPEWTP